MRKFLCILVFVLATLTMQAQDSLRFSKLDSLLNVYVVAIREDLPENKMAEMNFLIDSAKDSITKAHIALWLFDYYKQSPLMGEEELAIYIYDSYIQTGIVAPRSEFDAMDAKLFVDFNRSSLLGMQAPQITLFKPCGGEQTIPQKGKTALIWFYDSSCGKCKMEAKLLPSIIEQHATKPINFYAVYSGQSKKDWRNFRKAFRLRSKNVKLVHLWDPTISSDYLRQYGVISTPKLFMVEAGGLIIGRRLELDNLPQMFELDLIISQSNSL